MLKRDVFTELQSSLEDINRTEGMSQYLLLIKLEDIVLSPDLIIIELLNNGLHGLEIIDFNFAIQEARKLLKEGLDSRFIDVDIASNKLKFRPQVTNHCDDIQSFILFCKKSSGFILRSVYEKYLSNVDTNNMLVNIYINRNASSLLSSDSNYIVYDESISFMKDITKKYINIFHNEKLIAKKDLLKFILDNISIRESVIDHITDDIGDILHSLRGKIIEEFKNPIYSEDVKGRLKSSCLIGNHNVINLEILNNLKEEDRPGFSLGLINLFKHNILQKVR
ncbi:MAG: hypothetical protein ACRCX2_18010 [Paraclostridium sp.]